MVENPRYLTGEKLEAELAGSRFQDGLETMLEEVGRSGGVGSFKLYLYDGEILYPSDIHFYDKLSEDMEWGEGDGPDPDSTRKFPNVPRGKFAQEFCTPILLDVSTTNRADLSQIHLDHLNMYRLQNDSISEEDTVIRPIGLTVGTYKLPSEFRPAEFYQENIPQMLNYDQLKGSSSDLFIIPMIKGIFGPDGIPEKTLEEELRDLKSEDDSMTPVERAERRIELMELLRGYAKMLPDKLPFHRTMPVLYKKGSSIELLRDEDDLDSLIHYDSVSS